MSQATTVILEPVNDAAAEDASRWQGWLPLAVLPWVALALVPADWPRWAVMWSLALTIFFACKWLTWRRTPCAAAPWWRQAGYLLTWPGMDAPSFFDGTRRTVRPRWSEWLLAGGNVLLGTMLVDVAARGLPQIDSLWVQGWLGIAGIALALHFGAFHLLSCAWRSLGVDAQPVMHWPLAATSLGDFWGRRWNMAFRDLAHRFAFRPAAARWGAAAGVWAAFLASGVIHDLVLSLPARGGYGAPTVYFLVQAVGVFTERSRLGRRCGLGHGVRGRLFTFAVLLSPVELLFHRPGLERVIVPFIRAIGGGP
ncbi:MAG TPA: MBOAT family protein [Pirellulales bacterium]|nr:MBOAT family protein [Pirellulales bacterium]